jgi:SNF2 family DNA or RNA helicase
MDETWDPDDQTQATDRVHRASRIHQVTVYWLQTVDTVEDYIKGITTKKGKINMNLVKSIRLRPEKEGT